jgi:hypothetical protein
MLSRLLNRPLALAASDAAALLEQIPGGAHARLGQADAASAERSYTVAGGVAVVEVQGVLCHGAAWSW